MIRRAAQIYLSLFLCTEPVLAQPDDTSANGSQQSGPPRQYQMNGLNRSSRPSFIPINPNQNVGPHNFFAPAKPQAAPPPSKPVAKNPKLPKCDAPEVIAYFKHMIADSPMGRQKLLEAYSVDASDSEYSALLPPTPNARICVARVNTNAWIQDYDFNLIMKGPRLDQVQINAVARDN